VDLVTPLLTLGTSVVVAVISAYIGARIALRRFYSEKWWERRAAAYTAIIEAVHHIREHADTNLAFTLAGKDLPSDGDKELTQKLQSAIAELRKQRDIGSLVISDEAVMELNNLFEALEASTQTPHWQDHLEIKLSAIDDLLPLLRAIARKHLRLE
jgi:hypothetical protein